MAIKASKMANILFLNFKYSHTYKIKIKIKVKGNMY